MKKFLITALAFLLISSAADAQKLSTPLTIPPAPAQDPETMATVVMMKSAEDQQKDMRDAVGQMQDVNKKKQALRSAHDQMKAAERNMRQDLKTAGFPDPGQPHQPCAKPPCGLGAVGQRDQLILQELETRRNKIEKTLSDDLKKESDTNDSATGNMK